MGAIDKFLNLELVSTPSLSSSILLFTSFHLQIKQLPLSFPAAKELRGALNGSPKNSLPFGTPPHSPEPVSILPKFVHPTRLRRRSFLTRVRPAFPFDSFV